MVVVWTDKAENQLQQAFKYIQKNSPQNAHKVRGDIITVAEELPRNPGKFPPDKYKKDNDGSYRAFELHRYRISYRVMPDYIRIIRIRHTGMSPLSH